MGLIRTILALVILVILVHVGMVYAGVEQDANSLTRAIYSLGTLLESPAQVVINYLPLSPEQRQSVDSGGFYFTALAAAGLYFILYLLLGIGRRG